MGLFNKITTEGVPVNPDHWIYFGRPKIEARERERAWPARTELQMAVAINGGEELTDVHGEMPTGHVTTRGRHRERERSTANSPRG